MKKLLYLPFISILVIASCNKGLDDTKAIGLITETLSLSDKDVIKILGVSEESKTVILVKATVNEDTINVKIRKYDKGWQLEEVQNAYGAWLPVATVREASEKKIKSAMLDITTIATALVDYLTDRGTLPSQNGAIEINSLLISSLTPFYVKELPIKDPWGNNYLVYCGKSERKNYGIMRDNADDFLIISLGSDGLKENWTFDPANPVSGFFINGDSSEDLINYDGSWLRAPKALVK